MASTFSALRLCPRRTKQTSARRYLNLIYK